MARVSLAALAALAAAAAVAAAAAPPQRRRAGVGAGAGAARGAGLVEPVLPSAATAAARVGADGAPTLASIVSVADFGAVTGGGGDNTAAFQAALDSLAPTGGVVFVPAGNYSFSGALVIPTATALVGVYQSVPSHEIDQGATLPNDGSVLLPRANAGNDTATPFITVSENGAIKGFTIFYPDQAPDVAPVPYPWTIALTGNNPAVLDVELLNSWNGIQVVDCARFNIARVQGQPVNIGIYVDNMFDIGRIADVHWNPWYSTAPAYIAHQTVFGQAFVFGRSDWIYVLNTFAFAYSIGYRFIASPTGSGSCNGNFVGIGADCCQNASVWVDAADPWGILITNGEFTSFAGTFGPDVADHTQVVVTASNTGSVRFVNSAFWGPSNQIATVANGTVSFDSCTFSYWDAVGLDRSAIQVYGGQAQIRGCDFQYNHPQLLIADAATKVIFTDNLIAGALQVTQLNGAQLASANNLPDA